MTYQLTATDCILRTADNAFIPPDPANTDYQAYLKYVEEGGEVLPAPEPEPVPEPTLEQKLASAGLTLEELRTALGL